MALDSPQSIIVLYSKYSAECRPILELLNRSSNPVLFPLCIDNRETRKRVLQMKKCRITTVPTILLVGDDGTLEKFEGAGVAEWLAKELGPAVGAGGRTELPLAREVLQPAPVQDQRPQTTTLHVPPAQPQSLPMQHPPQPMQPPPQPMQPPMQHPPQPMQPPMQHPPQPQLQSQQQPPMQPPQQPPMQLQQQQQQQLQPVQQLAAPAPGQSYTSLGTPIGALARSMVPSGPPNPTMVPPPKSVKDLAAEMQAGRNNLDKPTQQLMQQTPLM